jgi:hypothetical protein
MIRQLAYSLLMVGAAARAEVSPDWLHPDGFEQDVLTAMRYTELKLRDPHLFAEVNVGIPLCLDVTEQGLNAQIATALNEDGDSDGFVDSSPLILFYPLDTSGAVRHLYQTEGECSFPLAGTQCMAVPGAAPVAVPYASFLGGADACLAALSGTTGGYAATPINAPMPPCFTSVSRDSITNLAGLELSLRAGRVAASFLSPPQSGLVSGLTRGFISEAVADSILIPADVPVIGNRPLSSLLKGGSGSCASGDDRDQHEGETGWWFYFNFVASPVPYS